MSDPVFSGPPGVPAEPAGSVVTVGTFDGVHRGHWAVLQETRRWAERDGRRGVVATFDPHPLRIVRPEAAPPLLTTPEEKEEILAESGLDYAVFLPFSAALSRYTPQQFVDDVLVERLHMRRLVIGYDHGFGRGRSGDVETLRRIGEARGFPVHVVPAVQLDGDPISSTRIRRALGAGDVASAAEGLGRPYALRGRVVRGDARGRELGFPTANLALASSEKLIPREGIYAVRALVRRREREGVLHLGPRPTFAGATPTIELHLFDFAETIYGEQVRLEFCAWIREVRRFAGVAELVEAIRADCEAARAALAGGAGACRGPEVGLQSRAT